MSKQWTILFIKDENSEFDTQSTVFNDIFERVDMVLGREETLSFFDANDYDIVISDLSVDPKELGLLKQLQDKKEGQCIFAFVSPKDTDKLYGIADMGVNAFELTPNQLEQALQTIASFDPYEEQS